MAKELTKKEIVDLIHKEAEESGKLAVSSWYQMDYAKSYYHSGRESVLLDLLNKI